MSLGNDSRTGEPLRYGAVGCGMIFTETYLPALRSRPDARLVAVASRTGERFARLRAGELGLAGVANFAGPGAVDELLAAGPDAVCVATPDDRHFAPAKAVLASGRHLLVEKPSVLSLAELDELTALAEARDVLAKVVYHKLLDPDHKRLRTHVVDGTLRHVNAGYCALFEPRAISRGQFAEWVAGRNPASYVAVHYLKLIDFTFGGAWALDRVEATGQRGIVGPAGGPTWDSVQVRVTYRYADGREATFDIHTHWVLPDEYPGYVDQEVQFHFDNGTWQAHQRKRGVDWAVEGGVAAGQKTTPNHHYNAEVVEPWGQRVRRGYGVEAVTRFFDEVAFVERGGPAAERAVRLQQTRALAYNDLAADRNVVAAVQSVEALLRAQAAGRVGGVVLVNRPEGGLVLWAPRHGPEVLYAGAV